MEFVLDFLTFLDILTSLIFSLLLCSSLGHSCSSVISLFESHFLFDFLSWLSFSCWACDFPVHGWHLSWSRSFDFEVGFFCIWIVLLVLFIITAHRLFLMAILISSSWDMMVWQGIIRSYHCHVKSFHVTSYHVTSCLDAKLLASSLLFRFCTFGAIRWFLTILSVLEYSYFNIDLYHVVYHYVFLLIIVSVYYYIVYQCVNCY